MILATFIMVILHRAKSNPKKGEPEKISIEKRCKYANAELVFYKKRVKHTVLDQEGILTKVNPAERKQKISELESFISENR